MAPKPKNPAKALEQAIAVAGSASALASALGVTPQSVCNWRYRKSVPVAMCKAIEGVTGIQAEALRPDVFGQHEAA